MRSFRQHHKPQAVPAAALTATVAPTATATVNHAPEPPQPSASAPVVVDLESLSVEPKRPPRAVRATPKPLAPESTEPIDRSSTPEGEPAAEPETPKSSDLPPAARPNPYSGSLIDQIKKATAEDEAGQ